MHVLPQQIANGLVLGSTYALVALGLTLVFGVLLIPNFAHGELYMAGAFVTFTLVSLGLEYWFAMLIAAAAVGLLGVIIDRLAFRPLSGAPDLSLMIAALAVSLILQQVASIIWGTTPRVIPSPIAGGIHTTYLSVSYFQLAVVGVVGVCTLSVWMYIYRTPLGLATRAVAQNGPAALLMGVDMRWVRFATFAIGATLGAIAGGLLGASYPIYPTMGIDPVLKAFVVLVLGGVGSISGAIVGGLFLGLVEVMVAGYISSQVQDMGAFAFLVLALLVRPAGLFGRRAVVR